MYQTHVSENVWLNSFYHAQALSMEHCHLCRVGTEEAPISQVCRVNKNDYIFCDFVDGLGKKAMLGWRDLVAFMFIGECID